VPHRLRNLRRDHCPNGPVVSEGIRAIWIQNVVNSGPIVREEMLFYIGSE